MHETLLSKEEFMGAEDLGEYYRVAADNRDLNYDKFYSKGLIQDKKVQPIHTDVSFVNASDELDIEAFKNWREEFKHAEFIAEYRLECNQLNNLAAIDVKMFEFFPAIEDLDVQVVYSQGQIKYELDANNTLIKLDR